MKKYKYSRKDWLDYYEDLEHMHITKEAKEDLLAKESNEEYSQRIMMEQVPKQEDNKECKCVNCLSKKVYKSIICDSKKLYKDLTTPSPLDEKQKPYRCSTCNGWIGEGGGTCKCSIPSPQEESKDIEKLDIENYSGPIKEMENIDDNNANIFLLQSKLNQVIDTLNSLTKRNIK